MSEPTEHFHRPWWSAASAALAAVLCAAPGAAVEWRSTPTVTMSTGHDDNVYLDPANERAVANATVAASTDITARNESFSFDFQPQVRAVRYDNEELADNRNDAFATLSAAWVRERQQWSLDGRYTHESTLTSGFEDTGLLLSDVDRKESGLNAGWSRRAGERGTYTFGAGTTRVRYGNAAFGYSDYDYDVIQAGYTLVTGTRSSWRFGASQSVVQVIDGGVENRSTSVSATWTHVFSPELTASLGVGVFDVATDLPVALANDALEDGDPTPSVDFSIERRWERWTLAARGSRELRPDGRGMLVREDSVAVDFDRRVTRRLSVGASLSAARTTDTFLPKEFASRDYAQTGVHARLSVGQRWWVSCSVDERAQEASFWPRSSGVVSQIAAGYRGR